MDRFNDLRTLIAVAEAGSISRAAERLNTTKSVVSRRLSDMEARLSVRLVNRVARGLTLTDAGRRFYERALQVLADLTEAEEEAAGERATPKGLLRIAGPVTFGTLFLSPALADFARQYPEITFDLDLDDRNVDLVERGYDVAIRIGTLPDSSLVARTLAPHRHVLCASPAYLAARGAPSSPDELKDHDALVYSNRDPAPTWRLAHAGGNLSSFRIRPRLRANNGDLLRDFAIAGLGLAALPSFIASDAIRRGELVTILPGWAPAPGTISAVYPASRHLSSKVRVLIDHLLSAFGPLPPWEKGWRDELSS